MTYEEFEWHILRMTYEEGVERLQTSYLAYALGLPTDSVNAYLEHAVGAGVLEMDVTEDGRLEYFVPGAEPGASMPRPVWLDRVASEDAEVVSAVDAEGHDGSVTGALVPVNRPAKAKRDELPPALRQHIRSRYGTDGGVAGGRYYAESGASIEESASGPPNAMVPYEERGLVPVRVESNEESFCDPSRTMFIRQLRVYGVKSHSALREHVTRLFQSLGYRVVDSDQNRLRFERGSVMFVLALVPLFVLVLPLFIYLFLYVMGRSTIHQEPLELDVVFRRGEGEEPFWEIDLTFVGLHGVILGAADQQVLNAEIDTLRDELRWALSA